MTLPTLSSILLRLQASSTWPQPRPEPGLYAAEWERLGRLRRASIHAGLVDSGKKDSERR